MIPTKFFKDRKVGVDILSILFGCGSWIAINGMWVELPIMVERLPEKWNLASYLSVIIQLANIAPIAYSIAFKLCGKRINNAAIIHVMMAIGFIACFLLGFTWSHTTYVAENNHSVALFVLLFFLSLVDCSSSVLFFPFMGLFKKKYLTSFMIGESFSGFVPSIVALGQGAGSKECRNISFVDSQTNVTKYSMHEVLLPPRFSVEVFFFFLAAMMVTSWLAFGLMKYHPFTRSEKALETKEKSESRNGDMYSYDNKLNHRSSSSSNEGDVSSDTTLASSPPQDIVSRRSYYLLLALQAWICFLANGFLPTVQTYSSLPYGNTVYHLAITFSSIISPAVCVFALFIKLPKFKGIIVQVAISTVIAAYLLITAIKSPNPPLMGTVMGEILIVTCWVAISGVVSFTKVCIANVLREKGPPALFLFGVATQAGSLVGAIIVFVLTVELNLFHSYNPC